MFEWGIDPLGSNAPPHTELSSNCGRRSNRRWPKCHQIFGNL